MSWALRILPEVADDLREARDYYEQRQQNLGDLFEDSFYAGSGFICQNPEIHLKMHGEFRRYLLPDFPYALWFRLDEGTVFVTLLFHCARNLAYLKAQLGLRRHPPN